MNRRLISIWLALIRFILGTALCPFNDLNGKRADPKFMNEEMTMTVSTHRMTSTAELFSVQGKGTMPILNQEP
jgi:hypothetical protein